jgi:hypothetical protein
MMAEDYGSRTVGSILFGGELAADGGRHAEYAEERRRHALLLHVLGMRADHHVHAGRSKSAGGRRQLDRGDAALQRFPGSATLAVADVAARETRHDLRQPLVLRVREGAQQYAIHDRVDRSICPDAQRERQCRRDRERWRLEEDTERVSQIAHIATLDGNWSGNVGSRVAPRGQTRVRHLAGQTPLARSLKR